MRRSCGPPARPRFFDPARCPRVPFSVVELTLTGPVWFWRGPAPWHFVTVPEEQAEAIAAVSSLATYGWGMIPVTGRVGRSTFTTSLWPKDGAYIVPLKTAVRKAEAIDVGDDVTIRLTIDV
jgi:hypothetical protein